MTGSNDIERVLSQELQSERRRNERLQNEIFELLTTVRELKLKLHEKENK
jgi:hypothetical protein